jgi:hypothetical protein
MKKDDHDDDVTATAVAAAAVDAASALGPEAEAEAEAAQSELTDIMIVGAENVAIADPDETEDEKSVSPVHTGLVESEVQIQVEADTTAITPTKIAKTKATKEPKAKATKEPKAKAIKEPKAKATKEPKSKAPKAIKEPKVAAVLPELEIENVTTRSVEPVSPHAPVISYVPVRENKASSDGKFYLMPNFPRVSFSHSGRTYLRTETDNVYDNMTLELIGVWDHLNHEIITSFDDEEEIEELWFSDEE